jgi:hypothetical protein
MRKERLNWQVATHGLLLCAAGIFANVCGCQKPMHFPEHSLDAAAQTAGALAAYDVNGDGRADFFVFADSSGRINRLGYDPSPAGEPQQIVNLDSPASGGRRHLVIILDGFGYEVVKRYYDAGGLRMFYPPSRVIAPYPTLTDLAIEDLLGYVPCQGFEAKYYDRKRGEVVGGSWAYLAGKNQPYDRLLDYRAGMIWDALGYLYPWPVFGKEVNDLVRTVDRKKDRQELLAYLVSSACIGTIDGAAGQERALKVIDRLVYQLVWSSHGAMQVTLTADHGHSYTQAKLIPLSEYLKSKGWRITDRPQRDKKDVAYVRFGLETYACFGCHRPEELAADLAACPGVTVASYAEGDSVVVLTADGRAIVRKKGQRYAYQASKGDPLKLKDILATLAADAEGFYDDRDVMQATGTAEYPDPLERLWRAHFSVAQNIPDVIVSLADEYYSGATTFSGSVKVASTHGGLNRSNSTAFLMSTVGPLPPLMRSADAPGRMTYLLGRPWPEKTAH